MTTTIRGNPSAVFQYIAAGTHRSEKSAKLKPVSDTEAEQRKQRLIATREQAKQFAAQQRHAYQQQQYDEEQKELEAERQQFELEKQQKIELLQAELKTLEQLRGKAQYDAVQYQQQLAAAAAAQHEYMQHVQQKQQERYVNARTIALHNNNKQQRKIQQYQENKHKAAELAELNRNIVTQQNELRHEQYPAALQFEYQQKTTKQLQHAKHNQLPTVHIEAYDNKLKQISQSASNVAGRVSVIDQQRQLDAAEQRRLNEAAERQLAVQQKALQDIQHERTDIETALNQLQQADKQRRAKQMELQKAETLPRALAGKHSVTLNYPDHISQQQLNTAFEREIPQLKQPQLFNHKASKSLESQQPQLQQQQQQQQQSHRYNQQVRSTPRTSTNVSVAPSLSQAAPATQPPQQASLSTTQPTIDPSTLSNSELDAMLEKLIQADKRIINIAPSQSKVLEEYERNIREYQAIDKPVVSSFDTDIESVAQPQRTLQQQQTAHVSISPASTVDSVVQQTRQQRAASVDSSITSISSSEAETHIQHQPVHQHTNTDDISDQSDLEIDKLIAQRNSSPRTFASALNDAVESFRQRSTAQYIPSTSRTTSVSTPVKPVKRDIGTISINITGNSDIDESMSGDDALAIARRAVRQSLQIARRPTAERKYDRPTVTQPHNNNNTNESSLNTSVLSSGSEFDDVVTSSRTQSTGRSLPQSFQQQKSDYIRRSQQRAAESSNGNTERSGYVSAASQRPSVRFSSDIDTPLSIVRTSTSLPTSYHHRDRSVEIRRSTSHRYQQLPEIQAANQQLQQQQDRISFQQRVKQYDQQRRSR